MPDTQQTVIVTSSDTLERVLVELAEIRRRLDAAQIQPRPEWISIEDYAAQAKLSVKTVRNQISAGLIEARTVGRSKFIRDPRL